jgi:uncharacterized membrane protein
METSNSPSNPRLVSKLLIAGFFVVALTGLLDSTYLTLNHLRGTIPPCSVVKGCDTVLTSSFSTLGSIPVALLGALYYLAILVGMTAYLDTKRRDILVLTARATTIGLLASLYFVIVQWQILEAWCQFCLLSALTSFTLFTFGMYTLRRLRKDFVL